MRQTRDGDVVPSRRLVADVVGEPTPGTTAIVNAPAGANPLDGELAGAVMAVLHQAAADGRLQAAIALRDGVGAAGQTGTSARGRDGGSSLGGVSPVVREQDPASATTDPWFRALIVLLMVILGCGLSITAFLAAFSAALGSAGF
jgi:hypothetical protein